MYLRRYRKPTVREALRAVREELGPDALVLATELVAAQGWRGWLGLREVQVTAGAERGVSDGRASGPERRRADTDAVRDGVVARLTASGIDPALAEAVAHGLAPAERRGVSLPALRRGLAEQLAGLVAGDGPHARVEVFVGPPGVGKTTTIAKIAAQARARHGRAPGMVAADAFRAGAVEQLRVYADVIGAPFRIARTADELDKALDGGRQTLLIDTAGRSPADACVRDLLRLVGRRRGVRTHLVLAADTSAVSARRIFDTYQDARPERLVITKLDEADTVSPLVSVIQERQVPVSYLAAGQRVPEDLDCATPALLASALLRDRQSAFVGQS
jgi:flagellar biosynthesis protein FlhF